MSRTGNTLFASIRRGVLVPLSITNLLVNTGFLCTVVLLLFSFLTWGSVTNNMAGWISSQLCCWRQREEASRRREQQGAERQLPTNNRQPRRKPALRTHDGIILRVHMKERHKGNDFKRVLPFVADCAALPPSLSPSLSFPSKCKSLRSGSIFPKSCMVEHLK